MCLHIVFNLLIYIFYYINQSIRTRENKLINGLVKTVNLVFVKIYLIILLFAKELLISCEYILLFVLLNLFYRVIHSVVFIAYA